MAALPALALAGGALSMAGAGVSAAGTIGAAKANDQAARNQWWNDVNGSIMNQTALNRQASEERFASQQNALKVGQNVQNLQSTLRANAAFGGGSATDDTVANLGGQIENQGAYAKAMNMYAGESRARGLQDAGTAGVYRAMNQGNMDVWNAGMKTRAARSSAMGTLIGSAGGMMSSLAANPNFKIG